MARLSIDMSPLTFAKIIDWVSTNTEREIGGYLIGRVERNKVVISDAMFATAESNPTHVSFDNMMQFKIVEELERKGSNDTIVGWFHSHPGLGCFMSGTDVATHKIYEALLPEAIAMVNDGNKFAKTRKREDFEAHFYKLGKDGKAFEVKYDIITDSQAVVDLLTRHVQDSENPEKIAELTAKEMARGIDRSVRTLIENKVLSKEEFNEVLYQVKKGIASTRTDLDKIEVATQKLGTKDELFDINKKLMTLEEKVNSLEKRQLKELNLIKRFSLAASLVATLGLLAVLVLVILQFLP